MGRVTAISKVHGRVGDEVRLRTTLSASDIVSESAIKGPPTATQAILAPRVRRAVRKARDRVYGRDTHEEDGDCNVKGKQDLYDKIGLKYGISYQMSFQSVSERDPVG